MGIQMGWRELHEDPVLAEELLTVDGFQGWGSQLSSEAWSWVIVHAPVDGLTPVCIQTAQRTETGKGTRSWGGLDRRLGGAGGEKRD